MDDDQTTIVNGLAAYAITIAEMGGTETDAHPALLNLMMRVGESDPALLDEAAEAIARFPQPIDAAIDEIESAARVREMLGVRSATEDLEASLRAREWLQKPRPGTPR